MIRQSISLTAPNDQWLNALLESEEYASKSEIVNDLIRRERERKQDIHAIRSKIIAAEQSGFTDLTPEQIKQSFKAKLHDSHL